MPTISVMKAIRLVHTLAFPPLIANGVIGILLVALSFVSNVQADPGDLDESFGVDGKVTTGFDIGSFEQVRALAIKSDGKIVAAGVFSAGANENFALSQYNSDGSPDDGFGTGGMVLTDFSVGGSIDQAFALSIQSDGKIVAAGISSADGSNDFALARYNSDGSPDDGFGIDGLVLTDFSGVGSFDEARALSIQSDGKIVAAGISDASGSNDFALARYNSDGSPDDGFGTGGMVLTDFSGSGIIDRVDALTIQSDGKIVAAGISDSSGSDDFALARYNSDGSPDDGFGTGGMVLTDFSIAGSVDNANALNIQTDGKIVAAGISSVGGSIDFALARYHSDGSLDDGFGIDGLVLTDISDAGSFDDANAMTIQSDGKIVAAGTSDVDGSFDFALARYNADGSLDNGFGTGGIVLTDFSGGESVDAANALAIQTDGKIIAAGESNADGSFDFALARYLESSPSPMPTPSPSPTPTPGGFQAGDANGDGSINILDVTAILNDILVISSASGNGDCNEDGGVNILDVTCVLNIILEV